MNQSPAPLDIARAELARSHSLADYEAIDVAWVAMVKAAHTRPEKNEHKRLVALLELADQRSVGEVLSHPGVDTLVSLEPPLETLLASPHERLDAKRTARELKTIREL